jgi:hypothetical protein
VSKKNSNTPARRDRFEWYPTPGAFTRYLFDTMEIRGRILAPCHGDGSIQRDSLVCPDASGGAARQWITNDIDPRWPADHHVDATAETLWRQLETDGVDVDWVIDNPAFTIAIEVIEHALSTARVGVAMHLRASIHEVLKKGPRRTWMARNPPTGILWLPRFGFQRSPKSGKWSQDSCCSCWVIWLTDPTPGKQFIEYCPERYLVQLHRDTPAYRARVDQMQLKRMKGVPAC